MPINWAITREDMGLLVQVAERVERDLNLYPDDRRTLVMDLNACHSNGCPLDFAGLLAARLTEFSYDIYGIRKAIDRTTGMLTEDVFMPRYALANRVGKPDGTYIDLTPVGCTTPEGQARVTASLKAFEDSGATLANAAIQFVDHYRSDILDALGTVPGLREDFRELTNLIDARRRKQEEFMRAVAGVAAHATTGLGETNERNNTTDDRNGRAHVCGSSGHCF